jgi:hypothetical protein
MRQTDFVSSDGLGCAAIALAAGWTLAFTELLQKSAAGDFFQSTRKRSDFVHEALPAPRQTPPTVSMESINRERRPVENRLA